MAVAAMPAGRQFITTTSFNTYFGVTQAQSGVSNTFTMLDAMNANGGGVNTLMRHGVSALLNVNSVNYPISDFEGLYQALKTAFATQVYEPLATELAAHNNLNHQSCPE